MVIGNMVTQVKRLSLLQKFMQIRSQTQSFIEEQSLIILLNQPWVSFRIPPVSCACELHYIIPFKYSYFATNISEDSTFFLKWCMCVCDTI